MVDEDDQRVGALDVGGEFAQRLAHQPRLQADVRVAHFAFDFRFGREGGDGVNDDDAECAGTHQGVGDFQRLLAGVGLGDVEVVGIDAKFARVNRIEGVFGINKGGCAACFLRFGDDVQGERRLAGRFRAVDFDDAPARQAADAERDVQPQRAGGDGLNVVFGGLVAKTHHRAFAELFVQLCQHRFQRFFLFFRDLFAHKFPVFWVLLHGLQGLKFARNHSIIRGVFQRLFVFRLRHLHI